MESTDQQHQGTCQDTERSPNLTIGCLPDEVLLEIFDSYRQIIDSYDHQWRKKCAWLNLAHVCRRWHAVVFASSSRLDLGINVGPEKPGHIKEILSSHLPIFIKYQCRITDIRVTGSALWQMRAALRHRDRVRKISFARCAASFRKFIRVTNYHFPALESLDLGFSYDHEPDIPATFLRGPDQADLRLRRLGLSGPSLASVSGLLLSATALTDLTLEVTFNVAGFDSSQGSFLAYLQGMQCLSSLNLTTPRRRHEYPRDSQSQHPIPKDIVPLLKLTLFHYYGPVMFLSNFMSGLSAPSLQDARFVLSTRFPLLYLSRVIDDVREEFRSVSVTFKIGYFRLLSSTHLGKLDRFEPSFRFNVNLYPDSINSTPSTKLALAEELALFFPSPKIAGCRHVSSLCKFLRQFRSVRVLRVDPFMREVGLSLQQDNGGFILPVLEEIEVSISPLTKNTDEYERHAAKALAAFEPFVSARKRAGRLVKVTIVSGW